MRGATPTVETVKASEARQRFSEIVNRVFRREARVLVEKSGIPVAAIVPAEDLERLERMDADLRNRLDLLARMRTPFAGIPEEEIEREAVRAVAEVRAEMQAEHEQALVTKR